MLDIKEIPGRITKAAMREHFEKVVVGSPLLREKTPLGAMVVNEEFSHYMNSDTDTMWIGFALGMRVMEGIQKAQADEGK